MEKPGLASGTLFLSLSTLPVLASRLVSSLICRRSESVCVPIVAVSGGRFSDDPCTILRESDVCLLFPDLILSDQKGLFALGGPSTLSLVPIVFADVRVIRISGVEDVVK